MAKSREWPLPDRAVFRYMIALIEVLNKKATGRIVKKIKKLKTKEAEVFLEKWRELHCARRDKMKHLCSTNIEECKQVVELVYREYRHLGIRLP
ncbi:MAG: hypothetical protein NTY33_04345 [Candidatus Moranbacteria bacterium]|nr:hypothetical protein [Candidatus Moranbacteria bacterium]